MFPAARGSACSALMPNPPPGLRGKRWAKLPVPSRPCSGSGDLESTRVALELGRVRAARPVTRSHNRQRWERPASPGEAEGRITAVAWAPVSGLDAVKTPVLPAYVVYYCLYFPSAGYTHRKGLCRCWVGRLRQPRVPLADAGQQKRSVYIPFPTSSGHPSIA